jgi:hypothetical protein
VALKLGSTGSALRVGSTTAKYARVGTTLKAVAPPLDIAGSAAAAYSLRKLSYAYTGPVVEVRRSSDDTTADFTADEVEDGTLAAWVGAGNDGFVATWYDQSGNSRDATQATAGYQPKIVNNGSVVTEGGKPAIEFDGSNDFLLHTRVSKASMFYLAGNVAKKATYQRMHHTSQSDATDAAAGGGDLIFIAADSETYAATVETSTTFALYSGSFDSGHIMFSVLPSGASADIRLNGAGVTATVYASPGVSTATYGSIGARTRGDGTSASQLFNGTVQELIFYPSDQTANRTAIEGNLCWHYGLENKLPYNHAEVKPQTLPTDTDVLAFAAASGAVSIPDLLKIEDLVAYLKAQSLWDYARFYPMKSAQNAGSGSTVYGLGGLTSNNMTLVNSPTWGSDGVTFASASSQYGNVGDVFNGGDLTIFARVAFAAATPTSNEDILGAYSSSSDNRSFIFRRSGIASGDPFQLLRASAGSFSYDTIEVYITTDHVATDSDECVVAHLPSSNNRYVWQGKAQRSLALQSGYTPQSSTYDSDSDVYFAATNSDGPANFANFSANCLMVITGASSAPTTTQRETITDLINAL